VTDVPVWVPDWVYMCCGVPRRVGEMTDLELTFTGDISPATGSDGVEVLGDGRVSVTGPVAGPADMAENHTEGMRVAAGPLRFAFADGSPAARVTCTGELEEIRHGYPSDVTRGMLARIQWRPAIERMLGTGASVIEGYEPGEELASTQDRPRDGADAWAFLLTLRIES
jgi:hypothetical protein